MDSQAPTIVSPGLPPIEVGVQALAPGTIVAGRYQVQALLGEGGMGAVYLGEHLAVGRKVAIKVLHAEWSQTQEVAARFAAEARTASAIGHPGIVDVLDAGSLDDGRLFLVMEHLDGRDLDRTLEAEGPMAPLRACRIVRAVAEAIAAAHAAGVIHRDLKPDNIIVVARGGEEVVKVLDFGVAADTERRAGTAARTTPGTTIGTPEHMSPEQAIGEAVGPHFDIYALGSVLFTLIAGRPPLVDANPLRLLGRKQSEAAPPLGSLVEGLPRALVELVADALAIDVGARPASVGAFVERLDGAIAALEAGPEIVGAGTNEVAAAQAGTGRSRSRPGAAVWASVGLLAIAGLTWGVVGSSAVGEPGSTRDSAAAPGLVTRDAGLEDGPAAAPEGGSSGAAGTGSGGAIEAGMAAATAAPGEGASEGPVQDEGRRGALLAVGEPAAPGAVVEAPRERGGSGGRGAGVVGGRRRAPEEAAHRSSRCAQVRELVRVARDAFRWETVLELARDRSCWEVRDDARKLEVQARMELGDLDGCVRAAEGMGDREVTRWREICRKRGGSG